MSTMSACGTPRSSIQLVMEFNTALTTLKSGIRSILEQYNVVNNTFVYTTSGCQEMTEGYFIVENEKDSLDEAIREVKDYRMGIRVLEGKKFQVGHIHGNWSDVCENENPVVDLSTGEIIKK